MAHTGAVLDITGELAASGIDVITPSLAHRGHDAGIAEHLGKGLYLSRLGTQQARRRKGVKGNQVEFASQALFGALSQQLHQGLRMGQLVVDPIEHAVFKGDEVARRMGQIAGAGVEQFKQRIFFVQWHQTVAQAVARGMQGHRQCHRAVQRQAVHHGYHARGRNRQAPP